MTNKPEPGDYGWGKSDTGVIAIGPVKGPTTMNAGTFWWSRKRKTIPTAIWDMNANRILDVDHLVEWHPLSE